MTSLAESVKKTEIPMPLRMEDRLDRALETLEGFVQKLAQDNEGLTRELVELRSRHAALEKRYQEACQTQERVSRRLDQSIDQLKLVLEKA